MLSIPEIEDLLMERIRAKLPYLATVETYNPYQVEWSEEVPQITLRLPGVLVMLAKRGGELSSYEDEDLNYTFSLGVVSKNLRGEAAGRRDPQGAYQILEDLRQCLSKHQLHEDLLPLQFMQEEIKFANKEYVMYAAEYAVIQEVAND